MKSVLYIRRTLRASEELFAVRLVLSPQQLGFVVLAHVEVVHPERLVLAVYDIVPYLSHHGFTRVSLVLVSPYPRVPIPQCRKDVNSRSAGAAVAHFDPYEDVAWIVVSVLHEHVPVLPLVEHSRVFQFVFGVVQPPPLVLLEQFGVRVLALRVLVQALHV